MPTITSLSLLRPLVRQVPQDVLGAEGNWNWTPEVEVDHSEMTGYCPGSGSEGGED